jgi:hypothetical protein
VPEQLAADDEVQCRAVLDAEDVASSRRQGMCEERSCVEGSLLQCLGACYTPFPAFRALAVAWLSDRRSPVAAEQRSEWRLQRDQFFPCSYLGWTDLASYPSEEHLRIEFIGEQPDCRLVSPAAHAHRWGLT